MTAPKGLEQILKDMINDAKRPRTQREDEANRAYVLGGGSIKDMIEATRQARQARPPR